MTNGDKPLMLQAIAALMLTSVAAFVAAWMLQDSEWLSRVPPPSASSPEPAADIEAEDAVVLYQSAFTAWVALVLLLPVFVAFWFRNLSDRAWSVWRAFWAVSAVAYLVHLAVAMFGFFGGDFDWMRNTSRVSAFWPGMVIAIWWPIDVVLSFLRRGDEGFVRVQRTVLHVVVLVLFVGGSLVTGELLVVKVLGGILLATAGAALARRFGAKVAA